MQVGPDVVAERVDVGAHHTRRDAATKPVRPTARTRSAIRRAPVGTAKATSTASMLALTWSAGAVRGQAVASVISTAASGTAITPRFPAATSASRPRERVEPWTTPTTRHPSTTAAVPRRAIRMVRAGRLAEHRHERPAQVVRPERIPGSVGRRLIPARRQKTLRAPAARG